MHLSGHRLLVGVVVAAVLALGTVGVVVAVNRRHDHPAVVTTGCAGLADLPPLWAVLRGATVGSYELVDVALCPAPTIRRSLRSDVSAVAFGGGKTAVVDYTGNFDRVAWLDGDTLTAVPGPHMIGTYTPGLSSRGDLAYTGYDGKQMSLFLRHAGARETVLVHRSATGVALHNPSWNAAGDLAVLEGPLRPNSGLPTAVLVYAGGRFDALRRILLGRSIAVQSFYIDNRTLVVVDADNLPDPHTRLLDLGTGRSTLLPDSLRFLASVPGRRAILVSTADQTLVLLDGDHFERRHVLGPLGKHLVEAATFRPPDAKETPQP